MKRKLEKHTGLQGKTDRNPRRCGEKKIYCCFRLKFSSPRRQGESLISVLNNHHLLCVMSIFVFDSIICKQCTLCCINICLLFRLLSNCFKCSLSQTSPLPLGSEWHGAGAAEPSVECHECQAGRPQGR